jgi:hypothetical protein
MLREAFIVDGFRQDLNRRTAVTEVAQHTRALGLNIDICTPT